MFQTDSDKPVVSDRMIRFGTARFIWTGGGKRSTALHGQQCCWPIAAVKRRQKKNGIHLVNNIWKGGLSGHANRAELVALSRGFLKWRLEDCGPIGGLKF